MEPALAYEEGLCSLGIEVITKESGYSSISEYLRAKGAGFGVFYLIRVDVGEAALATIRRAAPYARVIFHAPDLQFLRERRGAELNNLISPRSLFAPNTVQGTGLTVIA